MDKDVTVLAREENFWPRKISKSIEIWERQFSHSDEVSERVLTILPSKNF